MSISTCTVSLPEHPRILHVEQNLGVVEMKCVHFDGNISRTLCGNTCLEALSVGSSVVGFVYQALDVGRGN